MCPCGGELTVWCFEHGDWVCDDCGCSLCDEEWTDDYDAADDHDERHPYWFAGCGDCVERANWLEAQYTEASR